MAEKTEGDEGSEGELVTLDTKDNQDQIVLGSEFCAYNIYGYSEFMPAPPAVSIWGIAITVVACIAALLFT